jgi:hypothetical protein
MTSPYSLLICCLSVTLVSSSSSSLALFPPLNSTTVSRAEASIISQFNLPLNGTYGVYCNPCAYGDAIGPLVRLGFHDSVGGGRPNKKGGPNGCIDFTFSGNNGLENAVSNLTLIYHSNGFDLLMSKADFFVLAGNVAVRIASTVPEGLIPEGGLPIPEKPLLLPFRYGRQDDVSCDGVDGAFLPSPDLSYGQTASIFCTRVGMTPRQLVAIMGAHTLGRARGIESGFDGSWSGFSSSFSIAYYWQLIAVFWTNKDAQSDSWVAVPPSPGNPTDSPLINLKSSDVELIITPSDNCPQFNLNNFTSPPLPPPSGSACPVNALNTEALKTFSGNQTQWYIEFAAAWKVLTEFTYPEGTLKDVIIV